MEGGLKMKSVRVMALFCLMLVFVMVAQAKAQSVTIYNFLNKWEGTVWDWNGNNMDWSWRLDGGTFKELVMPFVDSPYINNGVIPHTVGKDLITSFDNYIATNRGSEFRLQIDPHGDSIIFTMLKIGDMNNYVGSYSNKPGGPPQLGIPYTFLRRH
jgi:hypothetical protein